MTSTSRFPAVLVYLIPFVGWLYVFLFHGKNLFAIYHLKQAVGLFLFLVGAIAAWVVVAWVIAWIPYMAVLSMTLFTFVIGASLYGVVAWLLGLYNALSNRATPLPWFGRWASRLPIG